MIPRKNPYANVSLAPPEPIQANFNPPTIAPMNVPQMQPDDNGGGADFSQIGAGLGMLRKKLFGGGAMLKGGAAMGAGGKA